MENNNNTNSQYSYTDEKEQERLKFFNELVKAIGSNDIKKISGIIAIGFDINYRNHKGETPLLIASKNTYVKPETYITLLRQGAHLEIKDNFGVTPLMAAIGNNNIDAATILVEDGANVDAEDNYSNNILMYAEWTKNKKNTLTSYDHLWELNTVREKQDWITNEKADLYINYVRNTGAEINKERKDEIRFLLAIEKEEVQKVKKYISSGVNINKISPFASITPLIDAIETENTEITNFLIEEGADVNLRPPRNKHYPLHAAVLHRKPEIVQMLINKGADINAKTANTSHTALDLARAIYNEEIENLLLQKKQV